ncbi:MAG: DUF1080 domain-containing protein [Anaerolineae bacterium]|nr:DUF1080 domain-containing protein [Anaerolineae bacterium]
MAMKLCPYCGAEVPESDLYCGECGRKIGLEPAPPAAPVEEKRKFNLTPILIGAGVLLCLCLGIVIGVPALSAYIVARATPTTAAILPPHTPTPTRVTPTATPTKVATKTPTPTPSPTRPLLPTFTPTPTPIPGPVLYEEDFTDPTDGWWTSKDADYEVAYRDGEYVFHIVKDDYSVWSWGGEYFTDFILSVEAGQKMGPLLNSYGVTFRFQDSDNFYRFSISGDGQYAIHRVLDGEWEPLVPWEKSPAVNAGENWNLLRVACQGPYMNFYINDVHVADVIDDTFVGGDIGFYVSTSEDKGNLEVAFDNLQVLRNDAPPATHFEFEDDFSKKLGGWETKLGEGREAGYKDNQFEISVLDPDTIAWSRAYDKFDDFAVEVEAQKITGPDVNSQGIAFRIQDAKNYYSFNVSSTGMYRFVRVVDSEWTTLVDWTNSPAINKGEGLNHLRVICNGSRFSFYVNGVHLTDATDDTFASGDIALWVGAYDEVPVTVRFDNVKLWLFD